MKFVMTLTLAFILAFASIFFIRVDHFDDQKFACIRAGGDGIVTYDELGIADGFKCQRMHLNLKYRDGEYK